MIQGTAQVIPSIGYALSLSGNGGKASFAVSPSSLIYSHFKNVSGVAAPDGQNGVSLSRLHLLDALIEGQRTKSTPSIVAARYKPAAPLDSGSLLNFAA